MIDLNDLRVFERVAALRGFSAAARALELPKSSVSRSVQRLEAELSTRLLQRTTREVVLTESGRVLFEKCAELLGRLEETIDYVGSLQDGPRGCLRVSTGIGFGIKVLGDILPGFLLRYPKIDLVLDLSSQPLDLVSERIDVAIRLGPMPNSQIVARKLGVLRRYACASPEYLARRGTPMAVDDLLEHDLIDMSAADGRRSDWCFVKGDETIVHKQSARIEVNDALTIHKLILNGAGIGLVSGFLCAPDFGSGQLVRLFDEWTLPSVDVHAVFPSQREMAPAVRAFIDYMRENSREGHHWQDDPIALGSQRKVLC
ncbi:LysR family transcriptional regulator [Sphingomonas sp. OK281]|uniref:LysR family transcriptional regulator n=1 Tax=Sphingomonas sp. OK281 TaxID=1881067 RepID=UPI0008E23E86|nr:LysR family transcriptional regulator [Sphingomonas sp. OK281]SFO43302.1 DNA-binding transcriptional regulator, LysR family [Sphingomonas sp. OK281]